MNNTARGLLTVVVAGTSFGFFLVAGVLMVIQHFS